MNEQIALEKIPLDFQLFRYDGYTYIGEWHPLPVPQLPKHLPPLPPLPRPFGTTVVSVMTSLTSTSTGKPP